MTDRIDWTPQQREIIRRLSRDPLSDDHLEQLLEVARRTGLDPLQRQIYATVRQDRQGGGPPRVAIGTSIDGMRLCAGRSGEYEGQTPTQWCGTDGVWRDVWLLPSPPAAAKVGVYRARFREPLYAVARYAAYAQGSPLWSRMGDVMIAKCAEALAIRRAFPESLAGIYTDDEMAQADASLREAPPEPGAHRAGSTAAPQRRAPGETPAALSPDPPHDPVTGEVTQISGPGVAQENRYQERLREVGQALDLQTLKRVWANVQADSKAMRISLSHFARLGEIKDLRKHELENPPPSSLDDDPSMVLGDDPAGLGP